MEYILLPIGLFLLIKGADIMVDGAAAVAEKLCVPPLIVGLTVVSFGTSAPEAAIGIASSIMGRLPSISCLRLPASKATIFLSGNAVDARNSARVSL